MKSNHTTIKTSLLFVTLFFSFIITIAYSKAFTTTEQSYERSSSEPPQDHACLVFEPPYRTVAVGDIFTLSIQVQADSHQVDGVAAYVDFDRSRLQIEQITLSSALPIILQEEFSNSTGTIDLAAGTISNYPTGTFEFAEIELAAIQVTPLSSIPFNLTPTRQSDITFAGNSILGCHTDANIAINFPTATPSNTPTQPISTPTSTPTELTSTPTPTSTPTELTSTPTPTSTPTNTPTESSSTPTSTPTQPSKQVCLVLEPEVSTITVGEPFTVTVQVEAGSAQVDGVGAYLDFDPTLLEVQQMTDGGALPLILEEEMNNATGMINFAAGTLSNFPSQTFDVVELVLQALAETTETGLTLNFTPPRQSDITSGGESILTCHSDGTIIALNMTATPTNLPTVASATVQVTNLPTVASATVQITNKPSATIQATNKPSATVQATNTAIHTPIISTQREFFLPIILKRVE